MKKINICKKNYKIIFVLFLLFVILFVILYFLFFHTHVIECLDVSSVTTGVTTAVDDVKTAVTTEPAAVVAKTGIVPAGVTSSITSLKGLMDSARKNLKV